MDSKLSRLAPDSKLNFSTRNCLFYRAGVASEEKRKEEYMLGIDECKPQHDKRLPKQLCTLEHLTASYKDNSWKSQSGATISADRKATANCTVLEHSPTETKSMSVFLCQCSHFQKCIPCSKHSIPSFGDDKRNRSIFPEERDQDISINPIRHRAEGK